MSAPTGEVQNSGYSSAGADTHRYVASVMNLTARDWLTVLGLAALLWFVLGAVLFGLVVLAMAVR